MDVLEGHYRNPNEAKGGEKTGEKSKTEIHKRDNETPRLVLYFVKISLCIPVF